MFARISILMWMALAVTQAEEKSPTRGTSLSTAEDCSALLNSEIERAQKDFAARMNTTRPTAEQRAIQIDRWQEETRTLDDQAKQAQATLSALKATTALAIAPKTDDQLPPEITSNPLLVDIHEIETEIGEFQKSLDTSERTAEQRAIQVEQFHLLNHNALEELKALKLQAVWQENPSRGNSGNTAPELAGESAPPIDRAEYLKAELDRIATQLSKVTPEDRAIYLETYSDTLSAMGKELSETVIISTNEIEFATKMEPAITQEPAPKTDP